MIKQKNLSLFLALIMIIQVLMPINQVFAENAMDNFDSPQTNSDGEKQKPEASTLLPEVNLKEEAEKPHIDLLLPQMPVPQEEQEKPHLGLPMAPWEDEVKKVIDEYEKINKENLVTRENKLENIFSKPKVSINDILLSPNTNEVTEVKNKDIIKAEYNWSTDQDINAGDYTLIPIPNNITMPKSIIRLLDIEGKEVGFASFENGFIRVQFNERLEGKVNKNGTLIFITEINEKDFEENINKTINFDGDKYNLSLKRESDSKLEKSARLGEDRKSINWEIDAVVSKNDIDKNIKLEDEMGTKFLDGKIEVFELIVGAGSITQGPKLGSVDTFPIDINKLNKQYGKNAFRFKFKTRIDNEFQDKYENIATLSLDGQKIQATANIENIISNEIKKTGQLIKKPGETMKVEWKILVNDKNRSYDKLIVKDFITKEALKYKQEYIKDSLKVIDPTVSKTEDIGKDKYNLTITDKDITVDLGKTDKSYEILYTTEVKYNNNFLPGTSVEITNKAELFNGDKSIDKVDSIVYDLRQKLINIWGSSTQDIPESQGGGKKLSWTELINDGKECLIKPTIETTLEKGHEFIEGSLKIVTHEGVDLVKGKDYDVVIEGNKAIVKLKEDLCGTVRLMFDTKITDYSKDISYKVIGKVLSESANDAAVGIITHDIIKNTINKDYKDYDYDKGTITWLVNIQSKSGKFKKMVLTDRMSSNLKFEKENLTIKLDDSVTLQEGTDYNISFRSKDTIITFSEEAFKKGKYTDSKLTLEYVGKFVPEEAKEGSLKNKIIAEFDTEYLEGDKISTEKIVPLEEWIINNGKKFGELDYKDKKVHWRAYLNPTKEKIQKGYINDRLSEGQRFVPDSLEAYVYYFDSKSPSPIIGNLIPKSDYKFTIHEDGLGYSIYFDNLEERVMLKYDSELHGKARKIYSNELTTSKDQHYQADVEHKTYDKFIDKKGKFDKVYAGEVLDWELTVNESYSDLKNVTITDIISGGHKYIDGSSKVINRFGKEIENAKLTINEVGNLQILKWELENVYDEFKITYNTLVTGNDQETISNKVTISSEEEEDIQTNNDYENIEIHQVGWGTGNGEVPKDRKDLKLIKVDEDGNKITIDSAEFKIFRLVGNKEIPQENYFSEDNDKFIFKTKDAEVLARGLNPGEYVIREVKAPKNHMLNEEDIYITINEDDNLIEKEIINKAYPDAIGKLEIVKIDAEDEKLLLEGAEFEILDLEGKLIDTLVTDKNGYAYKELPYGQYIIKEVKAPNGYLISNVERPVIVNGNKAFKKLTVTNIKEESPRGKIRILKVDSEYNLKEKEFIPLLKGAEFEIKDLKGEIIAKLVTDENGYAEVVLDYGEYKITEVKAPEGYESLDKDLLVEVDSGRNIIPIMVKNRKEEKPNIPGKPVEPENPENTEKPGKPGKPGEVVDPEQPVEKPGTPTTPPKDKPNKPLVPIVPIEPSHPEGSISWVEIEPSNKGPEKEPNKPESGLDKPEITNNKPSKPKEEIKELLPKTGYEDNKIVSILGIILLIIGLYSLINNKKRH